MKNLATKIREEIEKQGGMDSFSAQIKRNKNSARPSRFNLINDLQELTDYELNIAFAIGLIGNNSRKGSIVENACVR